MASFRIYKALPLEVYHRMINDENNSLPKTIQQPELPLTHIEQNSVSFRSPLNAGTEAQELSSAANIISLLPQRQQDRSKKILEVLQRCQISWDALGQLTDGKRTIPESNIVDLLNYLTCNMPARNANLIGLGEISSALKQFNAPICLFGREGKRVLTMEPEKQQDARKNEFVG